MKTLTTRIRSDVTDGAWIEAYMRGSWQVVYETGTKGDLSAVKSWVRETAPATCEDIIEEYERWLCDQAPTNEPTLSDAERSPFLARRYL